MTPEKRTQRAKGRAHGEGSVYLEHASGMWVAAVDLGIVNGRRKRKRLRFSTQKEARVTLTKLRKSLDDGIGTGDDRMTVRVFLDRWLRDTVEGPLSSLRTSTRASYAALTRKHLIPGLGHHTLAKLSPMHLQAFLGDKLTERDTEGAQRLSPRTVQYLHAVLRAALKQAERWGLVARNVARLVDAPTVKAREARVLTTEEAGRLLVAVNGDRADALDEKRRKLTEPDRLRALFTVAVAMGLRRGEIAGLRWEHVDLAAGVLRVREQLQRVKGKGLVVQDLKTERSRRTLKIPGVVLAELREHGRRQKAERLQAGPLWTETGYVFTTATGRPLDGRNLLARWGRALEDAGLPAAPFHAARHTAASFLLSQGASIYDVKENHGHSQIALTANTYAHLMDELRESTAGKADAALRAAFEAAKRPAGG